MREFKYRRKQKVSNERIKFSLVVRYRFTSAQVFSLFHSKYKMCTCSCNVAKKQVPFSMVIGNEEVVH